MTDTTFTEPGVLELSEEFDDSAGQFVNYDTYEELDRTKIWNQKHADIRVFEGKKVGGGGVSVLALSSETMTTLGDQTRSELSSTVLQGGEDWTIGAVESDPARNNWRGIELEITNVESVTESIQLDQPVDIATHFDDEDFISIALPAYTDKLDKENSYLELISIDEKVSYLSFSQSILPLTVGNMEFRTPRKNLIGDADLSNIVGVRIRYIGTGTGLPSTLKIMAIRILSKDWQYTKLDFDTRYNIFRHSVSLNGDPSTISAFDSPTIWRSSLGGDTPRPVNVKFGTIFNTGGKLSTNSITNYFRELTEDYLTQLDIDGLDQSYLNDKVQPDVGEARYNAQTQTGLEPFVQKELDRETQFNLERTPDFLSASWIEFKCQWSGGELLSNTSFEADALGAAPAGWDDQSYLSTITAFEVVDTWSAEGAKSLRFAGTHGVVEGGTRSVVAIAPDGTIFFPAVAGETYTASATINVAVNSGKPVLLELIYYDANKGYLASSNTMTTALGVTTLTVTGVAPAGTEFINYNLSQLNLSNGEAWDWRVDACTFSSPGAGDQVSITNTEVDGYTLPISPPLEPNKEYIFFTELEDNSVRAIIYPLENGSIQDKSVFDSTLITDDSTFPRRKGRFGWRAELNDNKAYIKAIRSHGVTYAEYTSLPFESFTPVRGMELFTDTIPYKELFTGLKAGPFNDLNNATIDRDKNNSISGESFRVQIKGDRTQQGVTSNVFKVEDFDETKIEFSLYREHNIALSVYLFNSETQRTTPFVLPKLTTNQWQHITLNIPSEPLLAGQYQFIIVQPEALPTTWWIDTVSVYERSINWAGRSVVDDPWKNNLAPWTPFKDFVNQDNSGILFAERGNKLQVRARALRQNIRISRIQFKPLYSQLGRLVWPENEIQGAHSVSIDSVVTAQNVKLSYNIISESSGNSIILAEWNLGDETYKVGSVINHTYDKAGTYTVSLVTTDKDGFRNIVTKDVVIA